MRDHPGNGVCTLRAAIQEAEAQATDDTIDFDIPASDPGYNGSFWTIGLFSALPDLIGNLTMQGPGEALLTIARSATESFRIFTVSGTETIDLSGLTLTNGDAGGDNGGAILNEGGGTLNVTNCTVNSNHANRGAGTSNQSTSTTNVINSTVSNSSLRSPLTFAGRA